MKKGILKRLLKVIGTLIAIPLVIYLIILFSYFIGSLFLPDFGKETITGQLLVSLLGIIAICISVIGLCMVDRVIGGIIDYVKEGETDMNNSFIVNHIYYDLISSNIKNFKNKREIDKLLKIKKDKQNGELSYCENSNDGNLSLCKERRKLINE